LKTGPINAEDPGLYKGRSPIEPEAADLQACSRRPDPEDLVPLFAGDPGLSPPRPDCPVLVDVPGPFAKGIGEVIARRLFPDRRRETARRAAESGLAARSGGQERADRRRLTSSANASGHVMEGSVL